MAGTGEHAVRQVLHFEAEHWAATANQPILGVLEQVRMDSGRFAQPQKFNVLSEQSEQKIIQRMIGVRTDEHRFFQFDEHLHNTNHNLNLSRSGQAFDQQIIVHVERLDDRRSLEIVQTAADPSGGVHFVGGELLAESRCFPVDYVGS